MSYHVSKEEDCMRPSLKLFALLGLLGAVGAVSSGCYPGYTLVRQAPFTVQGRTQVVVERVRFAPEARAYVEGALSRSPRGQYQNVDAWLQTAETPLNNAMSNFLRRQGYRVYNAGGRPPGTYVRAEIEVVSMSFGSRAGRALTRLFGGYARRSHPWLRARVRLYDGPNPNPVGLAYVQLEYNGGYEGFATLCGWVGKRLGYFVRDSTLPPR
jgi:hypothetical protein